jgi:hypothetical protein
MKNKGFTFIEIIVATTLLIMLTSMAATTAYNFIQSVNTYRGQFESLKYGISGLYATVSLAKTNYEADLASAVASAQVTLAKDPTDSTAAALLQQARNELTYWNTTNQNNAPNLIKKLLNVTPNIKNASYLPQSNQALVWRADANGNPVQDTENPLITDYDSLLRAFLLTDNRTPDLTKKDGTPNAIVAALTLGRILDLTNPNISPSLPQIDWRRGTMQEIVFPAPQTM